MNRSYIFTSTRIFNMSGWFCEKSGKAIYSLAETVTRLNSMKEPSEADAIVWEEINGTIAYVTKLYSMSCGADYLPVDADVICEHGLRGLELVAYRYGLVSTLRDPYRKILEFSNQIQSALKSKNRTIITTEINDCRTSEPVGKVWLGDILYDIIINDFKNTEIFREIDNLCEQKAQGGITWEAFEKATTERLEMIPMWIENSKKEIHIDYDVNLTSASYYGRESADENTDIFTQIRQPSNQDENLATSTSDVHLMPDYIEKARSLIESAQQALSAALAIAAATKNQIMYEEVAAMETVSAGVELAIRAIQREAHPSN